MIKTHTIKFLVEEEQFDRIKRNASLKGHKTISSYLRHLALEHDYYFENLIFEIHKEVVRNGRKP